MHPEQKHNGWSIAGTLQRENAQKKLSLQRAFGPEAAGAYTVQFSLQPLGPEPTIKEAARRTVADIEWSVAGNTIRRRISIGDGTTISGNAEAVRVVLSDATPFYVNHDTSFYEVSITIIRGTRQTTLVPPILNIGDPSVLGISGGGSNDVTIPVPQGVGVNGFYSSVTAALAATHVWAALPAGTVEAYQRQNGATPAEMYFDPTSYQWIPLLPGAGQLYFANTSLTLEINLKVLWSIDG